MDRGFVLGLFVALLMSTDQSNSQQWESTSLSGVSVFSFSSIDNVLLAGTQANGLHRSTDQGQSWSRVSSGDLDLAYIEAMTIVGNTMIAGTNIIGRATYTSTDSGITWNPTYSSVGAYIRALSARHDTVFAGSLTDGIYRSTNEGADWIHVGSGEFLNSYINSILWSGSTIFAGTHTNWSGIWKSTDYGLTWDTSNAGLPKDPTSGTWRDIPCIASNGNAIFAGTGWAGCYRSTNNGVSWDSVNTGLPMYAYVFSLLAEHTTMYLGCDYGVYRSTDEGNHWESVSSGLPANTAVYALHVHLGELYAGLSNGGVWKVPLSTLGVIDRSPSKTQTYELNQNFPNPFNSSTTISFTITSRSFVSLTIYSVLGVQVATILARELTAGKYQANWDGGGLASGVYFYQLEAGAISITKKLLLVK